MGTANPFSACQRIPFTIALPGPLLRFETFILIDRMMISFPRFARLLSCFTLLLSLGLFAEVANAEDAQGKVKQDCEAYAFCLPIDDVFYITGRGTIVVGEIRKGKVHTGETILLRSGQKESLVVVDKIEINHFPVPSASAGDSVGIQLSGISRGEASSGDLLVRYPPSGSETADRKPEQKEER